VIGTFVGAFWGLIALLLETELISDGMPDYGVHVLLIGLFGGLVLYFTVLLKISDAAYFSAVVMLSITVNHIGDANPYLFVFNRVLDTTIGVLVAEFVNRLHLPRVRQTDTLFIADLNETLLGRGSALSPYAKVELNRLLDDGARFSIFTMQTQATVRELLEGVELRYPIITMDGAALYDMQRREYLKVVTLTDEQSRRVEELLRREGLLELFDVVCGASGEGAGNAKWQVLQRAMDALGADTEESLLVGDTKYDVAGARHCGIPCIGVGYGYAAPGELEEAGALAVVPDLDALRELLLSGDSFEF
jgi:phosphoglycolate phosphatase-like HAD superfamily hydrolase